MPCSPPPAPRFAATVLSSASSTFLTCWLTIGCSTRWPIEPTGPAMRTSAAQDICVRSPSPARLNSVCMFMIAPTPLPLAFSDANSGSRSSSFSKSTVSRRPPSPSGTFTLADQCRSSCDLEPLDAGHQPRHLLRVVEHLPDRLARGGELLRSLQLHLEVTSTLARVASGS